MCESLQAALQERHETVENLREHRCALLQQNTKLLRTVGHLKETEVLLEEALNKGDKGSSNKVRLPVSEQMQRPVRGKRSE